MSLLIPNSGSLTAPAIQRQPHATVGAVSPPAPWEPSPFRPAAATILQQTNIEPIGATKAQQISRMLIDQNVTNQQLAARINDLIEAQKDLAHHFTSRITPLKNTFDQLKAVTVEDMQRREQERQVFMEEQRKRDEGSMIREVAMAGAIAAVTAISTILAQKFFAPKPGPGYQ